MSSRAPACPRARRVALRPLPRRPSPTRAFLRPASRLPKVPRPEAERPEAAHGPSTMGVCAPRVEPARARTRSCHAARVLPRRCPWLAIPSTSPCLKTLWTSPIKRQEPALACAEPALCRHRSATAHPSFRQLPSPVGTSSSFSSTYAGSCSCVLSRASSSFAGQQAAAARTG
jgi:hypothetical protein